MKNALWISRHEPTPEQVGEFNKMNLNVIYCPEIGAMNLQKEFDVAAFEIDVNNKLKEHKAETIFGVFAVPVLNLIMGKTIDVAQGISNKYPVDVYSSWNVQRSPDGGKPTFSHKKFVKIGYWV